VEAQVEALLAIVEEYVLVNFLPCDVSKETQSLKLGIPNECLPHLPRRILVRLTHLFKHCLRLGHFSATWKEANIITLPKPGKDPKFPENLGPIGPLPTTANLSQNQLLRRLQKHTDQRNLLNASQFGFRAYHRNTLQYMKLANQVSLNFNNNMQKAAVFLDIEKAFDTTWHSGLLYKLSELKFLTSLIKVIASFLTDIKFNVLVEGELSTQKK
jgi:hypothetical protein